MNVQNELKRLAEEFLERGSARDNLILNLYGAVTVERGGLPVPLPYNRSLSPEELQQFRSKIEPLSDEEIAEEIHQQKEDNNRKAEEIFKGHGWSPTGLARP